MFGAPPVVEVLMSRSFALPLSLGFLFLVACYGDVKPRERSHDSDTGEIKDTGVPWEPDNTFYALREGVYTDLASGNYATGASVAVWKSGNIIFAEGFGSRHPDTQDPVAPTTLFQIGSDTKKITALADLRAIDAKLFTLDTTLSEGLPDLTFARDPTWSDGRTVRNLLTHASGFYDYTPWINNPDDSQLAAVAYGRFAENEYAMNPAGEFWNYSNPNFSLAGLMAEHADPGGGRFWPDIVEQDIFAPLGMSRTFARLSEVAADGDYATGYGVILPKGFDSFDIYATLPKATVGTVEMKDQVDNAFTRPAGLVWSTATDMANLGAFLANGNDAVISDASLALITTPAMPMYPMAPDVGSYGMGMMITSGFWVGKEFYPTTVWCHGGNTMAMTSTFCVLPEERLAISILSNGYGDDFSNTLIAAFTTLIHVNAGDEGPTFPPADDIEQYAGTYIDPYGVGEIDLTYDSGSGELHVSAPDVEAAGFTVNEVVDVPYDDILVVTVDDSPNVLEVIDGSDGTPNLYLASRTYVATRTEALSALPEKTEPNPARIFASGLPAPKNPFTKLFGLPF
jgi:CubicO group peptidase (beta-lactamase class C family)